MQSLKNLVIYAVMSLTLLFGMTVSATATPSSEFEVTKAFAERGDANYQVKLGIYYEKGTGVRQDYGKAFYWYQKAANQGNSGGQLNLGTFYFFGKGVRQDYAQAVKWYRKAANQNNEFSQATLGAMYEYGKGVRQNKSIAKEWYGKSCDNGYQGGCDSYKILNEQGY